MISINSHIATMTICISLFVYIGLIIIQISVSGFGISGYQMNDTLICCCLGRLWVYCIYGCRNMCVLGLVVRARTIYVFYGLRVSIKLCLTLQRIGVVGERHLGHKAALLVDGVLDGHQSAVGQPHRVFTAHLWMAVFVCICGWFVGANLKTEFLELYIPFPGRRPPRFCRRTSSFRHLSLRTDTRTIK